MSKSKLPSGFAFVVLPPVSVGLKKICALLPAVLLVVTQPPGEAVGSPLNGTISRVAEMIGFSLVKTRPAGGSNA